MAAEAKSAHRGTAGVKDGARATGSSKQLLDRATHCPRWRIVSAEGVYLDGHADCVQDVAVNVEHQSVHIEHPALLAGDDAELCQVHSGPCGRTRSRLSAGHTRLSAAGPQVAPRARALLLGCVYDQAVVSTQCSCGPGLPARSDGAVAAISSPWPNGRHTMQRSCALHLLLIRIAVSEAIEDARGHKGPDEERPLTMNCGLAHGEHSAPKCILPQSGLSAVGEPTSTCRTVERCSRAGSHWYANPGPLSKYRCCCGGTARAGGNLNADDDVVTAESDACGTTG